MTSNVLVLGAGELGMAVLTHLAERAPPTTTLTALLHPSAIESSSAKISALRALNIDIDPGDIATCSISTLLSLFKPLDTIISCLGFASCSQVKIVTACYQPA